MKVLHKKILSSQVSMLMTLAICSVLPKSYASDVEIYTSGNGAGTVTLMLAIDTSRSMEEADDHRLAEKDFQVGTNQHDICYFGNWPTTRTNGKYVPTSQTLRTESKIRSSITYQRKSCFFAHSTNSTSLYQKNVNNGQCEVLPNNGGLKCYDRLTLVKDGLFDVLLGSEDGTIKAIGDDKVIGLSHFALINRSTTKSSYHRAAQIAVPARALGAIVGNTTQRQELLKGIANLEIDGVGGTPSAALLAETASYLMGRSPYTSSSTAYASQNYRYNKATQKWQKCKTLGEIANKVKKCTNWEDAALSSLPLTSRSSRDWYLNEVYRPLSLSDGDYYYTHNEDYPSGFFHSNIASRSTNEAEGTRDSYIRPSSIDIQVGATNAVKQCNGQGIYYLTDGEPNEGTSPKLITQATLGNTTNCSTADTCFTELAQKLFNSANNPIGLSIRTAVVGFGKDINQVRSYDGSPLVAGMLKSDGSTVTETEATANMQNNLKNITNSSQGTSGAKSTAKWGIYGRGGWYSGNNAEDVANSVNSFLAQIERTIPTVATGSPSIPVDSLNSIALQPYGYYTSFSPKPAESVSLWTGNLNKYKIFNGQLYGESNPLFKTDGSLDETISGLWTSGVVGRLKLKHTGTTSPYLTQRKIYTNRSVVSADDNKYRGNEITSLATVDVSSLFDTAKFGNDPKKNYWLNLLGYNVTATGSVTLETAIVAPELRQIGAVMHSSPLLLTQEGAITATNGNVTTSGREDYLLFGTTQGLLHVVDKDGKEVFAFVPHEMMENQATAMLSAGSTGGSVESLFYGIDAPWTAYTQYVSKIVGTSTVMTVKESGRLSDEDNDKSDKLKGMQWVYGGLRMGGKSYYALDLTDITKPELKFHIDPAHAATTNPIKFMGQSWSKPTIGFVNWKGKNKRVMFVGGGYDADYETRLYEPESDTIDDGAGVYMFDAETGELLWWASANNDPSSETDGPQFTQNENLKYSVPSQINALDRDGDGLIDNLYFGDLGSQVFRIDLNNNNPENFGHRVTLLHSAHVGGGTNPRFYEMPSISIHQDDKGTYGIVAFSSGNRSSPLAGSQDNNVNDSALDGIFVIFDHDLGRTDLYKSDFTSIATAALATLNPKDGVARFVITKSATGKDVVTYNRGWKHHFSNAATPVAGQYKGTNELYALDNMLYVNVYDRDGTGIGGNCGAGVKGDSYLFQYCLPSGKCSFYTETSNVPYKVKLGAGILGTGIGLGYNNTSGNLGVVAAKNRDQSFCEQVANKNNPECQLFNTKVGLQQLRWYED